MPPVRAYVIRLVCGPVLLAVALVAATSVWHPPPAHAAVGDIVTFADPAGNVLQPFDIASGPDGNLWFTSDDTDRIGRITTGGEITTFTDPAGGVGSPGGITAGPDGALWFTSPDAQRIGRITTTGGITTFADPAGGVDYPTDITVGADGALWFTDYFANRIGRVTTSGVITTFTDPSGVLDNPRGITTGGDGNVWFTLNGNKLGRITPSGSISYVDIPISAWTLAPDRRNLLWFGRGDVIGNLDFDDLSIRTFDLPDGTFVEGMTEGPDRDLWFTDSGGDRIGRIRESGLHLFHTDPTGGVVDPIGITSGPDGNVWFTNSGTNRIGRVTTNKPPVAVDDVYVTDENTPLTVDAPGLLANDFDPQGDPLHAVGVSIPEHGTNVFREGGGFVYTPDPDFWGVDSFRYGAFDDSGLSGIATVTIIVERDNQPPVAVDDSYTTREGAALTVDAPGVLGNDADADPYDSLTALLVTGASHGMVELTEDGAFTYVPEDGFGGVDTFTYQADDGAASDVATVTITVEDPQSDLQIAKPGGPYVGDDIYDESGQRVAAVRVRGSSIEYAVRIENDATTVTDQFTVSGGGDTVGFRIRYAVAGIDVTEAVLAGTYQTRALEPGEREILIARVTVRLGAPLLAVSTNDVAAASIADPTKIDAVRAVTRTL